MSEGSGVAVVTGATGFIGHALAEALRAAGWMVRGVDVSPADGVVPGDVSRPGAWARALVGADVVVHAAALVGMPFPRQPERYWRVNVVGTRRVVEAARTAGARRLVLVSSVVVFGNDFPDQVDETYPVRPTGVPYADTKIAAEQVVLAAHAAGEVEVTVVRPGDVYGPRSVWVEQPLRLMRRATAVVPGSGRGVFSPVYLDDLVAGVLAASTTPGAAGRVLTLSGGVGVPAGEFFDHLGRLAGVPVPTVPTWSLGAAARVGGSAAALVGRSVALSPDVAHYIGDRRGTYSIERAGRLLGWKPAVTLEDGMARVAQWARESGRVRTGGPR